MKITNDSVEDIRFINNDVDVLKFNGIIVWERQRQKDWGPGSEEIELTPSFFSEKCGIVFQKGYWFDEQNSFTLRLRVLQGNYLQYCYTQFVGGTTTFYGTSQTVSGGGTLDLVFDNKKNGVIFLNLGQRPGYAEASVTFIDDDFANSDCQCYVFGDLAKWGYDCFSGSNFVTDTRYLYGKYYENGAGKLPEFKDCQYLKYINLTGYNFQEDDPLAPEGFEFADQFLHAGSRLDELEIPHYIMFNNKADADMFANYFKEQMCGPTSKYIVAVAEVKP